MTWLYLALISATTTSLTTIFSKLGLKGINSNLATLIRTGIVIIFSFLLCLISGCFASIKSFTLTNYLFLFLSGIATGLSWLCYFKALKLASVNKVAPIDKSSFILTSILFLIFFFNETTNNGDSSTISALMMSIILMGIGTIMMIDQKEDNSDKKKNKIWFIYAFLSALFASLVSLFIKIGLKNINSNVATLFRTIIVFFFALAIVLIKKDYKGIKEISKKNWIYLILSSISTGVAWLSEYASYNINNSNAIAINSIGKLSILLTMLFSYLFLKEKFSKKTLIGLSFLTYGIIIIVIYSL